MTKIKDSFAILKNLVLEAKSEQNSNFESANSVTDSRDISTIKSLKTLKRSSKNGNHEENENSKNIEINNENINIYKDEISNLKSLLTQRDREIAILVEMVKKGMTPEEIRSRNSSAPNSVENRMGSSFHNTFNSQTSSNNNNNYNNNNNNNNDDNDDDDHNNNNNNGSNYVEEEKGRHYKDRDREKGQNPKQPVGIVIIRSIMLCITYIESSSLRSLLIVYLSLIHFLSLSLSLSLFLSLILMINLISSLSLSLFLSLFLYVSLSLSFSVSLFLSLSLSFSLSLSLSLSLYLSVSLSTWACPNILTPIIMILLSTPLLLFLIYFSFPLSYFIPSSSLVYFFLISFHLLILSSFYLLNFFFP